MEIRHNEFNKTTDYGSVHTSRVSEVNSVSAALNKKKMLAAIPILLLVIIAAFCVWWFRRSRFHTLGNKIPGPAGYPILGNLLELVAKRHNIVRAMFDYSAEYDGIFKFWVFHHLLVVISTPEYFQAFFSNTKNSVDKPEHYLAMSELTGKKAILVANGEDWKKARKIFVTTINQNPAHQSSTFAYATKKLISDLREKANGETFPVAIHMRQVALNVAWGNIFGELGRAEKIGAQMVEKLVEIEKIVMQRVYVPPLLNTALFKLFAQSGKYFENVDFIHSNMRSALLDKIKDYEELKKNNQALPNNFFYNHMEKYPIENLQDLVEEYVMLLQTSVITTPVAMGYLLICLGLFPEHQEKILDEYHDITSILGREPEYRDLHLFEYLDRVIKESMRMLPLFGVFARVLPGDVQLGKYTVPKNAIIVPCNIYLCHNPSVYPDASKFDPDRFLPENAEKMHPYAYLPFMAGPRSCPGKLYAMSLIKLLTPIILKEFKIMSHYKSVEEVLENAQFHAVNTDAQSFPIRLVPRVPSH